MTAPKLTMSDYLEARQDEATQLHALAQGAVELLNNVVYPPSPASNALTALLDILVERAQELGSNLDSVNRPAA